MLCGSLKRVLASRLDPSFALRCCDAAKRGAVGTYGGRKDAVVAAETES